VAAQFGAIHVPISRAGAGAARNAALVRATAPYVAFLDDDDVWLPGHIRGHLRMLESDPELGMVLGQIVTTDDARVPTSAPWPDRLPDGKAALLRMMLGGYFPQIGGTVVRASLRHSVGLFDEALLGDQDWDWHLRAARKHGVGFAPSPCVLFQQRPNGTFDALIARRMRFTRRVFFRHLGHVPGGCGTLRVVARLYVSAMRGYYEALVASTIVHAAQGRRVAAARAAALAVTAIPHHALRAAFRPTPFRAALRSLLMGRPAEPPARLHPEAP
jgi:glycosyltransferase involved in cell wall biosynthesis